MSHPHPTVTDETIMKHIAWCGVIVAVIAIMIATVANSVG
jgi:hypothetical protein